jgi:hypothetical protein
MALDFHLPGFGASLESPESYLSGMMRNFREASQALGSATDTLVVRLAKPRHHQDPDYQIETLDGEDAIAFSGATHDVLNEDITIQIEDDLLQDQQFTLEQVKDWLNAVNGEGTGGGRINPILSANWRESDASDPRD